MEIVSKIKNLKAGSQIIVWVIFIAVLGIIASTVGYWSVSTLGKGLAEFKRITNKTKEIADLHLAMEKSAMPVNDIIISKDTKEIQAYEEISYCQRLVGTSRLVLMPVPPIQQHHAIQRPRDDCCEAL